MRYFPVFLDLKNRKCVVVGGGRVAERKIQNLRKAGAAVTVVSPRLTPALERLKETKGIEHRRRAYKTGDLKAAFLAVAATDHRPTNEKVFREASARRIPVNAVDDPVHCTFIVPAVISRGDILIAISTGGRSPALAKALRKKLEREVGGEYSSLLKLIGAVRKSILPLGWGPMKNQKIYRRLLQEDVLDLLRRGNHKALGRLLREIIGPDFPLEEAGLRT
jgi:precorrin-2 dehydrogenase/sirohydrochlorin ferrochelatase